MTVMLDTELYYHKHGLFQPNQLTSTRFNFASSYGLPTDSVFHYLPLTETENGPAVDEPILANATRLVYIDHVVNLGGDEGKPRKSPIPPNTLINDYKTRNRRYRMLTNPTLAAKEKLNVIVENYALLDKLFVYPRGVYTLYYIWKNIRTTVYRTISNQINLLPERQHYIRYKLPEVPPALSHFKNMMSMSQSAMKYFTTVTDFDVYDLWLWMGKQRSTSTLFNVDGNYGKVNIVLFRNGVWLVINLGLLDSWRANEERGGIDPDTLQLRFFKLLLNMYEASNLNGDDDVDEQEPEYLNDEKDILDQLDEVSKDVTPDEIAELDATLNKVDSSELEVDEDGNVIESQRGESGISYDTLENQGYLMERTPEAAILQRAEQLVSQGLVTGPEYKRMERLATVYKELPNPYTGEGTLEDMLTIPDDDLLLNKDNDTIPDSSSTLDKSMLSSTVGVLDQQYIEKVLKKDIINAVMSVQQAGVAVTGYEVIRQTDAVTDLDQHVVTLTPVNGKQSTIRFSIPRVKPNGVYISNGSQCRLRKQRADIPIRKVSPDRVALSSYYSKLFVNRSERSTFNYGKWLTTQLISKGLGTSNQHITNLKTSTVEVRNVPLPMSYSLISTRVVSFECDGYYFYFDYKNRFKTNFFKEVYKEFEKEQNGVMVAKRDDGSCLIMHQDGMMYRVTDVDRTVLDPVGSIEEFTELEVGVSPTQMAELNIFGKVVPIGFVLGYLIGFDPLVKLIGAKYRTVPNGERLFLGDNEYVVRFLDESYVLSRDDVRSMLILSGFNLYKNAIRRYSAHSFNSKDVYYNILDLHGITVRYVREFNLMDAMFIDPITRDILKWMNEPTVFVPLIVRAVELLVDRFVPEKHDDAKGVVVGMELARGYERFAGAVYSELVKSIRTFTARGAVGNASIQMNPYAVWTGITTDPATAIIEQANPIHNLKEKEVISYGGTGGRSRQSMTAETRLYKESDMGFISEGTVDNGDVAIIAYMSPNANLTSVRGTVRYLDKEKDGTSTLISTAALLAPGADRDDPKRVNFINIQQSHGISANGYRSTPLSTGYDRIIAHRTDELFAVPAKKDGVVIHCDKDVIVIRYDDETTKSIQLGRRFGSAGGLTLPHTVRTDFKVGDKIRKGDIVSYNEGFFEPSYHEPGQVLWKAGVMAYTALMEGMYTLEDSSAISNKLAARLGSDVTKVRTVVINFDQGIRNSVKVGDHVDLETVLCIIEDEVSVQAGLFDDESADLLKKMSNMTPRAKTVGYIDKVEVFYHGDPEEMSESLQMLVGESDKQRRDLAKRMGEPAITGSVDQSLRVDGKGLDRGQVAIRYYISHNVSMGVGDKGVFANQMKTVVGHVLEGTHETIDGEEIDAVFGYTSLLNRIVLSPMIIGTTNTTLRWLGEIASDIYFGRRDFTEVIKTRLEHAKSVDM